MTSAFKVGTAGCCGHGGWVLSGFWGGCGCCGGRSGVFTTILFYISIIYHLKHYHQQHQFRLYNNSRNFLMS